MKKDPIDILHDIAAANARLIAAAPNLLAACHAALQAIKDAHHGISTEDTERLIAQAIAEAGDQD